MLKYDVGPFAKPKGMLLSKPSKRLTPKSAFLKQVEQLQRQLAKAAAKRAARLDNELDKLASSAEQMTYKGNPVSYGALAPCGCYTPDGRPGKCDRCEPVDAAREWPSDVAYQP